jgi:hypothetical protein
VGVNFDGVALQKAEFGSVYETRASDILERNRWRTATMPAKNKRRPALDIQCRFATYLKAHQRAYAWAERAIAYRQTGKTAQAKAAEQKARQWLKNVLALEAQTATGKPQGGWREEL